MKTKIHLILYICMSGFFLFTDQILKYFARTNPDFNYYFYKSWIGWEYFANTGIAFSLPFPNQIIIIFTPFIFLGLIFWFSKFIKKQKNNFLTLAFCLIIGGAISNYIDRFFFEITIDYLRFFTSVINLADIMIVGGAIILVMQNINLQRKND